MLIIKFSHVRPPVIPTPLHRAHRSEFSCRSKQAHNITLIFTYFKKAKNSKVHKLDVNVYIRLYSDIKLTWACVWFMFILPLFNTESRIATEGQFTMYSSVRFFYQTYTSLEVNYHASIDLSQTGTTAREEQYMLSPSTVFPTWS